MRTKFTSRITVIALVFAWGMFASVVRADDDYFMMVFAYEGTPNVPRAAHTFATFVKVSYKQGSDPKKGKVERHTISWLPASLNVRLLRRPESGKNLGLKSTLELGRSEGATISAWGPYRIQRELYDRALARIKRLDQGEVAYKALDGALRPDVASNCFHAVSDIVPGPLLDTSTAFGVPASAMVVEHLSRWIIDPKTTADWLIPRLGLEKEPIAFQKQKLQIVGGGG